MYSSEASQRTVGIAGVVTKPKYQKRKKNQRDFYTLSCDEDHGRARGRIDTLSMGSIGISRYISSCVTITLQNFMNGRNTAGGLTNEYMKTSPPLPEISFAREIPMKKRARWSQWTHPCNNATNKIYYTFYTHTQKRHLFSQSKLSILLL